MSPDQPPRVVALVRDLIFSTKIRTAASAAGAGIKIISDPAKLDQTRGVRLLADLGLPGAIDAAARWRNAHPGREVIGFVSHVDESTISTAREAGLDRILARSRFVELLPELLKQDLPPG